MEVRSIQPRLVAILLLSFCVALLSGVVRFVDFLNPAPLWLDLLFIVSAALSLTIGVSVLAVRMATSARATLHGNPEHDPDAPASGTTPEHPKNTRDAE